MCLLGFKWNGVVLAVCGVGVVFGWVCIGEALVICGFEESSRVSLIYEVSYGILGG